MRNCPPFLVPACCSSKTATIHCQCRGLRREWPAKNPIWNNHFERIVAVDARNHLWGYRCAGTAVSNMNLLFNLAA